MSSDRKRVDPLDPLERARAAALLLLKFQPRSESELSARLRRKGFGVKLVAGVLSEMKRKGLVDDTKFARLFATQKMLNQPVGKRVLKESLRAKGVRPEIAAEAIEEATEGVDEYETALTLARERASHMRGITSEAMQRRLFGFLSRRGFASDVVYRVVRTLREGRRTQNDEPS